MARRTAAREPSGRSGVGPGSWHPRRRPRRASGSSRVAAEPPGPRRPDYGPCVRSDGRQMPVRVPKIPASSDGSSARSSGRQSGPHRCVEHARASMARPARSKCAPECWKPRSRPLRVSRPRRSYPEPGKALRIKVQIRTAGGDRHGPTKSFRPVEELRHHRGRSSARRLGRTRNPSLPRQTQQGLSSPSAADAAPCQKLDGNGHRGWLSLNAIRVSMPAHWPTAHSFCTLNDNVGSQATGATTRGSIWSGRVHLGDGSRRRCRSRQCRARNSERRSGRHQR